MKPFALFLACVAGLVGQVREKLTQLSDDGLSAQEQLDRVRAQGEDWVTRVAEQERLLHPGRLDREIAQLGLQCDAHRRGDRRDLLRDGVGVGVAREKNGDRGGRGCQG